MERTTLPYRITTPMKIFSNKTFKYGLPFMILVVGAPFGLTEFTSLRYRFRSQQSVSREEAELLTLDMKKPGKVTLESEYEKLKKDIDIDKWENKRLPRPWNETEDT
uniref:Cytochrome c oxidase assembly protein COX16 homolog, mitochondrial n=1 Tax=Strigamia maritima TaxID=126957 RepID=T1J3W1_STRMM